MRELSKVKQKNKSKSIMETIIDGSKKLEEYQMSLGNKEKEQAIIDMKEEPLDIESETSLSLYGMSPFY